MTDENDCGADELRVMMLRWRFMAARWLLSPEEREALLPAGGAEALRPPKDTETRVRMLVEIGHRLRFEDDRDLDAWLRTPVPFLNWHSPLDAMSSSQHDLRHIRRLVEQGLGR